MLKITLNSLVNAVSLRREFIIFNRVALLILLYFIISYYAYIEVSIYNGLFHSTAITYSFDLFIYIIGTIIYFFTIFHARRTVYPVFPYNRFEPKNGLFSKGYVKAYQNTVRCFQVVSTYPKQNLSQRRHYSTKYINADALKVRILTENRGTSNNNAANPISIVPILSYSNADTMKSEILRE